LKFCFEVLGSLIMYIEVPWSLLYYVEVQRSLVRCIKALCWSSKKWFSALKHCIEAPRFLVKCIETLCWSSELFVLVCWNFMLKLPRVFGQLVCWSVALRFQGVCVGALKRCVEALSFLL
jgi:hypothetical protein